MEHKIEVSATLRGFAASYRPERGLVEMTGTGPGFPVPAAARELIVDIYDGFAELGIGCEVEGRPAALYVRISREQAAELAGALRPEAPAPELRWEARFNGGAGGASIYFGEHSTFLTGRPARQLAEALDPGRASRPFAAEIERRAEDGAREAAALAARLRHLAAHVWSLLDSEQVEALAIADAIEARLSVPAPTFAERPGGRR